MGLKAILGGLIGGPVGLVGTIATELVTNWREGQQNKRGIKRAAAEFRQEQARGNDNYKREWELRALEGADIWPRRLVLMLFAWPFIWAYFDPEAVQTYFRITLAVIPEWYIGAFMMMLSVLWGVVEMRNIKAGLGGKT